MQVLEGPPADFKSGVLAPVLASARRSLTVDIVGLGCYLLLAVGLAAYAKVVIDASIDARLAIPTPVSPELAAASQRLVSSVEAAVKGLIYRLIAEMTGFLVVVIMGLAALTIAASLLNRTLAWGDPLVASYFSALDRHEQAFVRPLRYMVASIFVPVPFLMVTIWLAATTDEIVGHYVTLSVLAAVAVLTTSSWLQLRSGLTAMLCRCLDGGRWRLLLVLLSRALGWLVPTVWAFVAVLTLERGLSGRLVAEVARCTGSIEAAMDGVRRGAWAAPDAVLGAEMLSRADRLVEGLGALSNSQGEIDLLMSGAREGLAFAAFWALFTGVVVPLLYAEVTRLYIVAPLLMVTLIGVDHAVRHFVPHLMGLGDEGPTGVLVTVGLVVLSCEVAATVLKRWFHRYIECWNPACKHRNEWHAADCSMCRRPLPKPVVVGNAGTRVAHRPDCDWLRDVEGRRLVGFDSLEAASAARFRACKVCWPARAASCVAAAASSEGGEEEPDPHA